MNEEKAEDDDDQRAHFLTPDKRKAKIALSQPALYSRMEGYEEEMYKEDPTHTHIHNTDNISCIVQNSMQPSF